MGKICVPRLEYIFIYCHERDFLSHLSNINGWPYRHVQRYLFIILTICSSSITLNLRNIFLIYIQKDFSWIYKANTSDKETSFFDLDTKDIDCAILITFMSISPGLVVMFLDSDRPEFIFCSWVDLLGVLLEFWISIQKPSKLRTQGYRYHQSCKMFGEFVRSYSELLSILVQYRFRNMFQKEYLLRASLVI